MIRRFALTIATLTLACGLVSCLAPRDDRDLARTLEYDEIPLLDDDLRAYFGDTEVWSFWYRASEDSLGRNKSFRLRREGAAPEILWSQDEPREPGVRYRPTMTQYHFGLRIGSADGGDTFEIRDRSSPVTKYYDRETAPARQTLTIESSASERPLPIPLRGTKADPPIAISVVEYVIWYEPTSDAPAIVDGELILERVNAWSVAVAPIDAGS